MTDYNTIEKLTEMHMSAMANAFRLQIQDPKMKDIPFEDRFGMIVDVEYTSRKNNRLKRLIKNASFEQVNASIADIVGDGRYQPFCGGIKQPQNRR